MKKTLLALLALLVSGAACAAPLWMRYPALSPDGRQIAFAYRGDLYVVDAEGGQARRLTSGASHDFAPVWSPDSRTIAYASDRHGNFDLYAVAAEGAVRAARRPTRPRRFRAPSRPTASGSTSRPRSPTRHRAPSSPRAR